MLNSSKNCTAALSLNCFIIWAKSEFKNLCLSVSEILGVSVKTLTADGKYSVCNRKNLMQPIQLLLPKKQKNCFEFFCYISEIDIIF